MTKGGSIILRIYFALVSLITLVIMIISVSDIINIGLRTYVFPKADEAHIYTPCEAGRPVFEEQEKTAFTEADCEKQRAYEVERLVAQKQRDLVRDISLLIVSFPLFWLHFRIVYRDWRDEKKIKT